MYDAKSAAMTGASDSDIYAAQSQSGRRKSTRLKPATDKGLSVGVFPPTKEKPPTMEKKTTDGGKQTKGDAHP